MDDSEALVVAAGAGSGIVQVPDYMVQAKIDCGRLRETLAPFRPQPMPISVVYPSNRQVPPRTKAFVDLLDSPPKKVFDCATRALRAPIALISLCDCQRQYFDSAVGLPPV